MEAKPSVQRASAKILSFPVTNPCSVCGQQFDADELSGCLRCGAAYCRHCEWECQCDRDALEIVQRACVPSLWQQFRAMLAGVL